MGDLKTRYYEVTVTVSDLAGNIGSDTCKVVIIPSCNPDSENDVDLYDSPFDGDRCENDGDVVYPFLFKNNEIGVGEITNDDLPFEKCAAFCRPYIDYEGYVGFATELGSCGTLTNCNRCLCFFEAGFLPVGPYQTGVNPSNEGSLAVGPANGGRGSSPNKCYPYKVSLSYLIDL